MLTSCSFFPTPGFGAPIWRWTFLGVLAAGGLYRYTSTHTTHAAAPASDDELEGEPDDDKPFLTRYITYHVTKPSIWKERSDRHLDAVRQRAEDRLLFQDAERPPIHRLRFPGYVLQSTVANAPTRRIRHRLAEFVRLTV